MCIFSKPKVPKPEPIPPKPTADSEETRNMQDEQDRKARLRRGSASTKLSGPLGDVGYGGNISRATVLGGVV